MTYDESSNSNYPMDCLQSVFDIDCDLTPDKKYHTYSASIKGDFKPVIIKEMSKEKSELINKMKYLWNPYRSAIYAVFEFNDSLFVVTEKIFGDNLFDMVNAHNFSKSPFIQNIDLYYLILQLCDSLKDLHKINIIHKDLSPLNIFYNPETKRLKVIDFGESRFHTKENKQDTHIIGTKGYAAPDMLFYKQSDIRADIYSIGCIINFLVTGVSPVEKIYDGDLFVKDIIKTCLEEDRNKRYKNTYALQKALFKAYYKHFYFLRLFHFSPFTSDNVLKCANNSQPICIADDSAFLTAYNSDFLINYTEFESLQPYIEEFYADYPSYILNFKLIRTISKFYNSNNFSSRLPFDCYIITLSCFICTILNFSLNLISNLVIIHMISDLLIYILELLF